MKVKTVVIECCYWCPNCEYDDNPGDPHYVCTELDVRIDDEDEFLTECPFESEEVND